MRGLSNFIYDIRHCASKEDEQKRVNDELAKVRKSFTSKQTLGGYDKKKYVWKLVYMYMLGYDVEIGHMEALKLISSSKYTEKQCGYLACSILLNENHEIKIADFGMASLSIPNAMLKTLAFKKK